MPSNASSTACGTSSGSAKSCATFPAAAPHLAVVDLSLDGRSGRELIRDLKQQHPQVAVLVLSMHDEDLYAERALRAGARGYIMKREATQNVIAALRRIRDGRIHVSERIAERLAERAVAPRPQDGTSPLTRLSDRELEVFRLMGQGRATRQIAETLNVSAKTVQAYHARMKEKLGLATGAELLREAIRWAQDDESGNAGADKGR